MKVYQLVLLVLVLVFGAAQLKSIYEKITFVQQITCTKQGYTCQNNDECCGKNPRCVELESQGFCFNDDDDDDVQ
ncbi:hypothetical protein TTHERM_01041910 (macronuclear) [Tetrahymena thermophila SB210]|uniref:Transmembrane protein n=1 Tax=Tetrahymena thermophila (strain SB210) TaxID=312017 RepID=Q24D94_TETTS|nr:hypothetical protein TTHERM_01041910 [Tetrahymena thermophila SB210]EAS05751.1 hypothetical protein TTHERM_01041910 [Tetrahymena thermophila SB210]|eukprot:XP_001025996.1 hypothetical protein TTHERM_01041910 [Tetrahymena thermophila SB210]